MLDFLQQFYLLSDSPFWGFPELICTAIFQTVRFMTFAACQKLEKWTADRKSS